MRIDTQEALAVGVTVLEILNAVREGCREERGDETKAKVTAVATTPSFGELTITLQLGDHFDEGEVVD